MKINKEWLKEKSVCSEGVKWFKARKFKTDSQVIGDLMADDKLEWANWVIARIMKRKQYLSYTIFAAEQVLELFEKKYPDDKRPREAIEAARAVFKEDTAENRVAARVAWVTAGVTWVAWDTTSKGTQIRILKHGLKLMGWKS